MTINSHYFCCDNFSMEKWFVWPSFTYTLPSIEIFSRIAILLCVYLSKYKMFAFPFPRCVTFFCAFAHTYLCYLYWHSIYLKCRKLDVHDSYNARNLVTFSWDFRCRICIFDTARNHIEKLNLWNVHQSKYGHWTLTGLIRWAIYLLQNVNKFANYRANKMFTSSFYCLDLISLTWPTMFKILNAELHIKSGNVGANWSILIFYDCQSILHIINISVRLTLSWSDNTLRSLQICKLSRARSVFISF